MVASSKTNNYLTNISGASKVALGGFDPVAFFKVSKPINGNFKMTAEHKGATYFFVNEKNKQLFQANPNKYAPQHGGFCSFGVSVGALFPVDITTAQVYKDKLYVNLNKDILDMFNEDLDANIAKADASFKKLSAEHTSVQPDTDGTPNASIFCCW